MVSIYPACFYEEKEGGYSVVFPDLDHLATCGRDLQEAIDMARDCLAGYLYDCIGEGEMPVSSKAEDIDVDTEYQDYKSAFVKNIAVDAEAYAKMYF